MRRRQQVEAAEKRIAEQERRGIGNIDAVKRKQQRAEEVAKRQDEAGTVEQQTGLKVNLELKTLSSYENR